MKIRHDDGFVQVCGPNIGRVNHSCSRWNSTYDNITDTSRELRATTSTSKGEEITLFYDTLPPVQFRQPNGTVEARAANNAHRARLRRALKLQFNFDCQCQDCVYDCGTCWNGCPPNGKKLRMCQQCGIAWYCSRECQKAHWKEHKLGCQQGAIAKESWETRLKDATQEIEMKNREILREHLQNPN